MTVIQKKDLKNMICDVQQGSLLGLLLFIIYINNLCQVSDILKLVIFADDASVFRSSNNIKTLF